LKSHIDFFFPLFHKAAEEEARRRAEEEARRRAEEEEARRRAEEEARRRAEEEAKRRAEEEARRRALEKQKAIDDLNDLLPNFLARQQHEKETNDMMDDFNQRAKDLADWIKERDDRMKNDKLGDDIGELEVTFFFFFFLFFLKKNKA